VVMSVPLDGEFADELRSALGAHVLLHAGQRGATTSMFRDGRRVTMLTPPAGVAADVLAGGSRVTQLSILGEDYSVGYQPLKSLRGAYVGMLGVATPREPLLRAKSGASRSLLIGSAAALALALALTGILSRRLTRPLRRLHAGTLAIARGDLDTRL